MKLDEAREMIGVDVAIVSTGYRWKYGPKWTDLKKGYNGTRARLEAVGKFRTSAPGACGPTSYVPVEYGSNVAIVSYPKNDQTLYMEVPFARLMSWSTYTQIKDEREMRESEWDIMKKARAALVIERDNLRLHRVLDLTRAERAVAVDKSDRSRPWSGRSRDDRDQFHVTFRWNDGWDTKELKDLAARIEVINKKMECKL